MVGPAPMTAPSTGVAPAPVTDNTDFWRRILSGEPLWQVARDAMTAQDRARRGMNARLDEERARSLDDAYLGDPSSAALPAPTARPLPASPTVPTTPTLPSPQPPDQPVTPDVTPTVPSGGGGYMAGGMADPRAAALAMIQNGAASPVVNGRRLTPLSPIDASAPDAGTQTGAPTPPAAPAQPPDAVSAAYGVEPRDSIAPGTVTPMSAADRRAQVLPGLPQAPEVELPDNSGWKDILRFGLATMKAGGTPGASLGSALGSGGLEAMAASDQDLARRNQAKQAAFGNEMARTNAAAAIAGQDTKEAQTNRQLDIEQQKVVESAKTRLAELQAKIEQKGLDRDQQRALSQERMSLQRLIAEGNQGNARALTELRAQMAASETERKAAADQDRANSAAGSMYERMVKDLKDPAGNLSQDNENRIKSAVAKAHPKSEFARNFRSEVTADAQSAIAQIQDSALPEAEKKKRIDAVKARTKSMTGEDLQGYAMGGPVRRYANGGPVRRKDAADFTDRYNTQLSPEDEAVYRQQYGDDDSYDYDMRGAFKAGATRDAGNGHLPDTFKKPNHPTFSNQSQYSGVDGYEGGEWVKEGNGWKFIASPTNVDMLGEDGLRDYFQRVEPGNRLEMPSAPADSQAPVRGYARGGPVRRRRQPMRRYADGGPVVRQEGETAPVAPPPAASAAPVSRAIAGPITGPGGGTDDRVPAMVSPGEFVMPADVVADIGNGSSEHGFRMLNNAVAEVRQAKHGTTSAPPAMSGVEALKIMTGGCR